MNGLLVITMAVVVQTAYGWNFTFSPPKVYQLPTGSVLNISVNASRADDVAGTITDSTKMLVTLKNSDDNIANVMNANSSMVLRGSCSGGDQCLLQGFFTLEGLFLGFSNLDIMAPLQAEPLHTGYSVSVINPPTPTDDVFSILVMVIICIMNFSFGCSFDLAIAKEVAKAPLAPFIGFFCQYGIMPAMAFLIGYLLDLPPAYKLGLLTLGCSPGGGMSNMITLQLGGDLTLSICMTFFSTVAAIGMMPLWLLTLGVYITGGTVSIPFVNLLTVLATLVLPLLLGIGVNKCFPKLAILIKKIAPVLAFIILIALLIVAIISQSYMARLVMNSGWRVILSSALLPYAGLLFGAILSAIAQQPKKRVLTIAVETCVQNSNIAVVILKISLEQPTGDMATIVPVISQAATALPFILIIVIKTIVQKCCRNKGKYDVHEKNGQVKNNNVEKVFAIEPKDVTIDHKSDVELATMY